MGKVHSGFYVYAAVSFQVAELQTELDSLKVKYASLSRETKITQDEKDVEIQKVFCLFCLKPV